MKFCFGDIVVIEGNLIGVVVKSWASSIPRYPQIFEYEVYVRDFNAIKIYSQSEMERYMVRHKYLNGEELEWQHNAVNGC